MILTSTLRLAANSTKTRAFALSARAASANVHTLPKLDYAYDVSLLSYSTSFHEMTDIYGDRPSNHTSQARS